MWGTVKCKNAVGTGRRRMRGVIRAEMFGQLTSGLEAAWNKLKGEGFSLYPCSNSDVECMCSVSPILLDSQDR